MANRGPKFPVQLLVHCPACRGAGGNVGCPCGGFGRVPGLCMRCQAPAFHRTPTEILCPGCYYSCALCGRPMAEDDRLPAETPGHFLHAFCALARQILENAVLPDNTGARTSERTSERARARTEDPMPKPSPNLVSIMRGMGYVTTTEAVELTGHGLSTIYDWVASGRLRKTRRSGQIIFLDLGELEQLCPQVRGARAVNE